MLFGSFTPIFSQFVHLPIPIHWLALSYQTTVKTQGYFLQDMQSQSLRLFTLLLMLRYSADEHTWRKLPSSAYINSQLPTIDFASL